MSQYYGTGLYPHHHYQTYYPSTTHVAQPAALTTSPPSSYIHVHTPRYAPSPYSHPQSAYETTHSMPPSATNYGSAPGAMHYVFPQSGYATSTSNTQHLCSWQPSQRAPTQHHAAHVPVQNQYWYQEIAQAQYQSSQNLNPNQYQGQKYQGQSQHESPHRFQCAQKPEQTQHSPAATSAQRIPVISWRRKLICSAVECEFEDVQLKEPPFPFYQRWDEDAENIFGRGKKRSRSEYEYEGEDDDDEAEESYDHGQNGDNDYDEEHTTNAHGFCCDPTWFTALNQTHSVLTESPATILRQRSIMNGMTILEETEDIKKATPRIYTRGRTTPLLQVGKESMMTTRSITITTTATSTRAL
jgi:hypothetical protein